MEKSKEAKQDNMMMEQHSLKAMKRHVDGAPESKSNEETQMFCNSSYVGRVKRKGRKTCRLSIGGITI